MPKRHKLLILFSLFIILPAIVSQGAASDQIFDQHSRLWFKKCPAWVWDPTSDIIHENFWKSWPGYPITIIPVYEGIPSSYHFTYVCHIPGGTSGLKIVNKKLPDGRWGEFTQIKAYPAACSYQDSKWFCDQGFASYVTYPLNHCDVLGCYMLKEQLRHIYEKREPSLIDVLYGKIRARHGSTGSCCATTTFGDGVRG